MDIPPLLRRYFPASSVLLGSRSSDACASVRVSQHEGRSGQQARSTFRIATAMLQRADGSTLRNVVLTLNAQAQLLSCSPLTSETASTVWHRGTLRELPSGEVVEQS